MMNMISLMDMKMIKSHFQDCFEFIDKCNNSQGLISPHILNFENIGDLIILSMKTKTSTIITRLLQNKQINVSARLLDGIIPRHLHNTNYPIDYHLQIFKSIN